MSNSITTRLASLSICTACRSGQRIPVAPFLRPLSTSRRLRDDKTQPKQEQAKRSTLDDLAKQWKKNDLKASQPLTTGPIRGQAPNEDVLSSIFGLSYLTPEEASKPPMTQSERRMLDTYHFHVYATKHNTHITLTNPKRDPKISLSCGNMGFKKANRGTYEAAYQLASYVLKTMIEKGLMAEIKYVEVMLRGFGVGREAVTKAIMGPEGRMIVPKVIKVSDGTRLKFGGTRSPKPRRLG